jgi:hypothetical protein
MEFKMKYKHLKGIIPISAALVLVLATACSKEWDEHYDEGSFNLPDKTVTEYINEQPLRSLLQFGHQKTMLLLASILPIPNW